MNDLTENINSNKIRQKKFLRNNSITNPKLQILDMVLKGVRRQETSKRNNNKSRLKKINQFKLLSKTEQEKIKEFEKQKQKERYIKRKENQDVIQTELLTLNKKLKITKRVIEELDLLIEQKKQNNEEISKEIQTKNTKLVEKAEIEERINNTQLQFLSRNYYHESNVIQDKFSQIKNIISLN
jgi:hypothetical protein